MLSVLPIIRAGRPPIFVLSDLSAGGSTQELVSCVSLCVCIIGRPISTSALSHFLVLKYTAVGHSVGHDEYGTWLVWQRFTNTPVTQSAPQNNHKLHQLISNNINLKLPTIQQQHAIRTLFFFSGLPIRHYLP